MMLERIAVALERIASALEQREVDAELAPVRATMADTLQARADYNRDHAAELYSDMLTYSVTGEPGGLWYENATGLRVVFTPYGWSTDSELWLTR